MNIILIFLAINFIKIISSIIFIIYLILWIESSYIINKKMFISKENVYEKAFYYPKIISELPDKMEICELIYIIHYNSVFNITYNRILKGNLYFLREFKIKNILRSIILFFFNISFLLINIVLILFKIKNTEEFVNFLYKKAHNAYDNRVIININNKWEINGGSINYWNNIRHLDIFKSMSKNSYDQFKDLITKTYDVVEQINNDSKFTQSTIKFINKNKSSIPHKGHIGLIKNTNFIGYETDYNNALSKDNYGLRPVINKFIGNIKYSIELEISVNDVSQISKEKKVSLSAQSMGAIIYGHDSEIISRIFHEQIKDYENIIEELGSILKENNEFMLFENKKYDIVHSMVLHSINNQTIESSDLIKHTYDLFN